MSGITPDQERAVDPFASYNSNVVNRLTNMMTRGNRGVVTVYDLQVTIDSTSPTDTVVISGGYCFKDDVLIQVLEDTRMQILGSGAENNYAHNFNPASQADGYYYIVLYYNFQKSRPAPQATLYAVESTNTGAIYPDNTGDYVLLKVVEVLNDAIVPQDPGTPENDQLLDYDPGPPTNTNVREYMPTLFGAIHTVPVFDATLHTGRMVYDIGGDVLKYGAAAEWKVVGVGTTNKVTYNINAPGDWSLVSGVYRNDNSIAALGIGDRFASITLKDNATHELIIPYRALLTTASNCRIEMPVNTVSVGVTVIA
jgi:hypothetical protein